MDAPRPEPRSPGRWAAALAATAAAATGCLLAGGRPWAVWGFAGASGLFPVLLVGLATARRRRGPLLTAGLGALAVLLVGSLLTLVAVGGRPAALAPVGGVPLALAVLFGGLWLLPLLLVGAIYAATFDPRGLAPQELAELRRRVGGEGR